MAILLIFLAQPGMHYQVYMQSYSPYGHTDFVASGYLTIPPSELRTSYQALIIMACIVFVLFVVLGLATTAKNMFQRFKSFKNGPDIILPKSSEYSYPLNMPNSSVPSTEMDTIVNSLRN